MNRHAQFIARRRFDSLDGLRAVSILAVIWHHTQPDGLSPSLSYLGIQGVTLFFAISGFLITTLLVRERERNGGIDIKAFYVRRVLRIFPLYYGVLLLYTVVVYFLEKDAVARQAFFDNLPYFTTFTSNIFVPLNGRVIFYFSWSLAVEEQFYLVWPVAMILAATRWRAFLLIVVVLGAFIASEIVQGEPSAVFEIAIAAGAMLALVLHSQRGFRLIHAVFGHAWSFLPVTVLLAISMVSPQVPNYLVHLLCVSLVACCVIREDHAAAPLLTQPAMLFIGTISYGMYLLHMLVRAAVVSASGVLGLASGGVHIFLITLAVTIFVASLSYRYFESFFLKLKRNRTPPTSTHNRVDDTEGSTGRELPAAPDAADPRPR